MKKINLLLVALLAILSLGGMLQANASANTSFVISSGQSSIVQGETATLLLTGQNLADLYSYEAVLTYDPQKVKFLQAQSSLEGVPVSQIRSDGRIVFAFTKVGNVQGVDGNEGLSVVTFEGLAAGQTEIRLESVKAFNSALSQSAVYAGNTVSLTVAANTSEPPSNPDPDNGGSSGSHDLGTIAVSGDATLLTVSAAKLNRFASTAQGAIVIDMSSIGQTSAKAVDIPAQALSGLQEAGKDVVIQAGGVHLLLPPNSLKLDGVTDNVRIEAAAIFYRLLEKTGGL